MLPSVMPKGNLLAWLPAGIRRLVTRRPTRPAPPAPGVPLMRPNLAQLARPDVQLPAFVAECAVARKYLDLLGPLDWNHFPERPSDHPWPGKTPAARAPYLVKINEGQRYMSKLMQMPSVPVTQNDPLRQGAESDQMISKRESRASSALSDYGRQSPADRWRSCRLATGMPPHRSSVAM